jgi:hypothetical protein
LLKEVKDILDEIKMIRTTLSDQCGVLDDPQLKPEAFTKEAKSLLMSIDKTFSLMEIYVKDVEEGVRVSKIIYFLQHSMLITSSWVIFWNLSRCKPIFGRLGSLEKEQKKQLGKAT